MAKAKVKPKKAKKAAAPAPAATSAVPARKPAAAAPAAAKLDTSVLDELLKTTGQPAPTGEESLPDFVLRVATAMAEVPDDKFNGLSVPARKWYDENSASYNAEKLDALYALPGMPGYTAPTTTAAEAAPQPEAPAPAAKEEKKQETPQTQQSEADMAKAKKGGKKAAGKSTKKTTNGAAAERAPRTDSVSYQVRMAVVKKPDITFPQVAEKLGLKGAAAAESGSNHAFNYYNHARIVIGMYKAQHEAK